MEPYIGELRMFAFNRIPKNWAPCNGSLLSVLTNQALFSIIGTMYGGDGRTTFALPDLRGRIPMHGAETGARNGTNTTSLTTDNLAPHSHTMRVSTAAVDNSAASNTIVGVQSFSLFAPQAGQDALIPFAPVSTSGPGTGGQPVTNMQPYLGLCICISLSGLYPSRG